MTPVNYAARGRNAPASLTRHTPCNVAPGRLHSAALNELLTALEIIFGFPSSFFFKKKNGKCSRSLPFDLFFFLNLAWNILIRCRKSPRWDLVILIELLFKWISTIWVVCPVRWLIDYLTFKWVLVFELTDIITAGCGRKAHGHPHRWRRSRKLNRRKSFVPPKHLSSLRTHFE